MRNLVAAFLVVGLLAVPTFGTVFVKVVNHADGGAVLNLSQASPVGTVDVMVCGNNNLVDPVTNGVLDLAGSVVGTGTGTLTSSAFAFDAAVNDMGLIAAVPGSASPLGGWSSFGKASLDNASKFVSPTYAVYASYTVTASANGTINLNFVNFPDPNGLTSGLDGMSHITTDGNNATDVSLTGMVVNITGFQPGYASSAPADGQSFWREAKNIIRITFDGNIGTVGAFVLTGKVQIIQMTTGGGTGTDVTANWAAAIENDGGGNPRVLKIQEIGATTMTNRQWYAVRNTGGWSTVANFTRCLFLQKGDVDRSGAFNATDTNLQLQQPNGLNKPDNFIYDYDGSKSVSAVDSNHMLQLPNGLKPNRPTGWTRVPDLP